MLREKTSPSFAGNSGESILTTGRVSVQDYVSEKAYERDRATFASSWLMVGRLDELPDAGCWITRDIECLSVSLIIARGKDLKIRAFHNICLHRGMRLLWESKGKSSKFVCPYHGWTYNADGALAHAPDAECFPGLNVDREHLPPVECGVWEEFVFVRLGKDGPSLQSFLGLLSPLLMGAPFGAYRQSVRFTQIVEANWKLALEGANETYHVGALHRRSVGTMMVTKENPHVHLLEWARLGLHHYASVPGNGGYQIPADRRVQTFSAKNSTGFVGKNVGDGATRGFEGFAGLNRSNNRMFQNDLYGVFPNLTVNLAHFGWFTQQFWPLSKSRTRWEVTFYYHAPQSLRETFARASALALQRDILTEDLTCLSRQQTALSSGALTSIQFGEQEQLCRHIAATHSNADDRG